MEQKIDVMIDEATVEARIAEIAQQLSKEYYRGFKGKRFLHV